MNLVFRRLAGTTLGLKLLMAGSGAIWIGFVCLHMLGNLLIFAGADVLNEYGHFIQHGTHGLVWVLRVGLIVAVVVHVVAAIALTRIALKARPEPYRAAPDRQRATYASLTMRYGGPTLLLFVLYHLSHYTLGWSHHSFVAGDVYGNVVRGFQVPWVSGLYVAAMAALGLHLYHGLASALQTLGIAFATERRRHRLSGALALTIFVGNSSIPVAVLLRLLETP
ncbi:MAG: succinate dehydrogenase cytochrome b subunit [Myxococcales bacterium]|nr:succinate dehydrogenase cytochrome b subunit [Myxococcales bacterium]